MNVLELKVGGFYKSNGGEYVLFSDPENKTNADWVGELNAYEPFVLLTKPIDYDAQNSDWKANHYNFISFGYIQRKRMWMKILTSSGIVGWSIWTTNVEFEEVTNGDKT